MFGLLSIVRAGVVSQYVFSVLNSIQVSKYIHVPIIDRVQGLYRKMAVILFDPSLWPGGKLGAKKKKKGNANYSWYVAS